MAPRYRMLLDLDEMSREALAASGSRIVLAKPSGSGPPNVAWLAWTPEARNVVSWAEIYGIYAADVATHEGAPIRIRTSVYPANDGTAYPYADAFGPPCERPRIPRGHYDVTNDTALPAAFGLLQYATVNGSVLCAPVNTVVVPAGFEADFVVAPTLYAWVQPAVTTGSVATHIPRDAATVKCGPNGATLRFRYDAAASALLPHDKKGSRS